MSKIEMNTLIFKMTSKFLLVLMLVFSLWTLFRGHNAPGGGFIAGLITSSAFALYLMAFGKIKLRSILPIPLPILMGIGFLLILISGLVGWVNGFPFLTSRWFCFPYHLLIGSPLVFDVGVYLVVAASILMLLMALGGDEG